MACNICGKCANPFERDRNNGIALKGNFDKLDKNKKEKIGVYFDLIFKCVVKYYESGTHVQDFLIEDFHLRLDCKKKLLRSCLGK